MKRLLKLLALGSVILVVRALAKQRRGLGEHGLGSDRADPGLTPIEPAPTEAAISSGLAEIDPQPLTHVAGEGVVPGSIEESRAPGAQSARLPRPGKNLP